jgi:hypothetical protein
LATTPTPPEAGNTTDFGAALDHRDCSRHCWAAFSGETEMQVDLHNTAQIFGASVSALATLLLLIRAWIRRRTELFKDRGATRARATE